MSEQSGTEGSTATGGLRARLRERIGARPWVRSAALVGSGLIVGGILAGTVTANAVDDDAHGTSASREDSRGGHGRDGDGPGRDGPGRGGAGPGAGEEALTGDRATQVEEAVLAEYPDAEIERLETDADGVYEAHVVTADGEELTVELDEDFAVTGTE